MKRRCALLALTLAASVTSCGGSHDAAPAHAALGGKVVARVADIDLPSDLVAAVAKSRNVTPGAAVNLLVDDAVAAKAALARGFDRDDETALAMTAVKARATVAKASVEAHKLPPTDEEIRQLTAVHWLAVDAPEGLVVVHAVVTRPDPPDAQLEAQSKEVAAAIAKAVATATSGDDFQARAKEVPHPEKVKVVVQPLEPFSADGRVMLEGSAGTYDKQFSSAAAALAVGTNSGVVESPFGWHVIRLIERHPEHRVALDERRRIFTEEVYARRGQDTVAAIEAATSAREPVALANGVDEILAGALPVIRGEVPASAQ